MACKADRLGVCAVTLGAATALSRVALMTLLSGLP